MSQMHETRTGEMIKISEMSDSHLQSTIQCLEKRADTGVVIRYGGGTCAEDIWYDEDVIFGADAKKYLGIHHYKAEQKRRMPKEENVAKIKISCFTCRKNKLAQLQEYSCEHRENGTATLYKDSPCDNWLPTKAGIRHCLKQKAP
jgi:hypothetical protein